MATIHHIQTWPEPHPPEVLPHSTRLLCRIFETIRIGHLGLTTPEGNYFSFGKRDGGPQAHIIVHHPDFFRTVLERGSLALGESYVKGWWDVADKRLTDFFGIILRNRLYDRVRESALLSLHFAWEQLLASPRFLRSARKNIVHHYDLGNEFFQLMLDPTMAYSCGYQLRFTDSLEQMQQQKYRLLAEKLGLGRGGSLLDIGCGWGGFLIYAAEHYARIRGKGITLSPAQTDLARKQIAERGLSDRVQIELLDYRRLTGKFDYVVSVGMFEHVGRANYSTFFAKVAEVLREGGTGLLHCIGVIDPPDVKPDPWMATYIFPGYRLPRLDELTAGLRQAGLLAAHIENLKPHYAVTLFKWRERVERQRQRIRALDAKYDDSFFRLWKYYLCCCEAGFRYGEMQLYQLLFTKGNQWTFPLNLRWEV
jgi:cyclopropane-fatty-acyl-phospholipid synthase